MQLPCTWRVSAHPSHSSSSSSSSPSSTTTTTNPQHQICRPQNNLLQQVQEHSGPEEEEEVPSLGEAPACSQAHSACVHPSPADLQAPSARHYPPASSSSSLSRRSLSGQPAARPYHRWQHPLLVLLSVCPVTIRRRSLHCSPPWLQTELLACLFVCLFVWWFVCLLACLLACVGVMERTSSHQSSESVQSNLEAELWIPDGEMRNQQRNSPAINPQEEQTNKRTHFYFKACRLKLLDSCPVRSVRASFNFSS